MEFEDRIGNDATTSLTFPVKQGNRPALRLASYANNGVVVRAWLDKMPTSVAIRAQEIALLRFSPDPCGDRADAAEREILGSSVTVVELERRGRAIVATILAVPASRS